MTTSLNGKSFALQVKMLKLIQERGLLLVSEMEFHIHR